MEPPKLINPYIRDILRNHKLLTGVHIDDKLGPRTASLQIASCESGDLFWKNEDEQAGKITTGTFRTRNDYDSNYTHHGWPSAGAWSSAPWVASRISRRNQPICEGSWITHTAAIRRLNLRIPLESLVASSEFVADVERALGIATDYERFQGFNTVLDKWGDVIALNIDLGTSVTATGSSDMIESLDLSSQLRLEDISALPAARMRIQGGDTDIAPEDVAAWLLKPVTFERWAKIEVSAVVPVTSLLPDALRIRIEQLYAQLISYDPKSDVRAGPMERFVDGSGHALKTIREVILYSGDTMESFSINYWDETQYHPHGAVSEKQAQSFSLRKDEFIIEVLAWSDEERLCALQFLTNKGRVSQNYGGTGGRPSVLQSHGGVLVGFSTYVRHDHELGHGVICKLQTIWRHYLAPPDATQEQICSDYLGGTGGEPFCDWQLLKNSCTAHVSCIRVRSGSYIHSIQVTYRGEINGKPFIAPSWPHGGTGGLEDTFQLEAGEFINGVSGRHDGAKIMQLCFQTNRDRTSSKYGRSSGRSFKLKAPAAMDGSSMWLRSIVGKSSQHLNGLTFVWAPACA